MIPAPRLNSGDTIAVFSPSSPATATANKRYLRGIKYLQGKGYHIVEGKLSGKKDYYRSGTILERADELNDLIRNPKVKCIMSAIGGMNSNSLLPYIDYAALKDSPKIIVGYSDVTAILLAVYAKTGLTTFYGPAMVASFGEFPPFVDMTFDYFKNMLGEKNSDSVVHTKPSFWTDEFINWDEQNAPKAKMNNNWLTLRGGRATGRLIGGNLSTITGIWGSPYMPPILEGDILMIEDALKDAATVERLFSMLKINGVFSRIGGLILGKHELFDDCGSGRRPHDILNEVMGDAPFPVLADFDCCHTHPMFTMPIGGTVELDTNNQKVTIKS